MLPEEDLSQLIMIAHLARTCRLFNDAERMFQHFSHAYPLRAFPHIGLGLVYMDTERHAKACHEFEQAIELGEKGKDIYLWNGICQFVCGRYAAASEALYAAIELDGDGQTAESARLFLEHPQLLPFSRRPRSSYTQVP